MLIIAKFQKFINKFFMFRKASSIDIIKAVFISIKMKKKKKLIRKKSRVVSKFKRRNFNNRSRKQKVILGKFYFKFNKAVNKRVVKKKESIIVKRRFIKKPRIKLRIIKRKRRKERVMKLLILKFQKLKANFISKIKRRKRKINQKKSSQKK